MAEWCGVFLAMGNKQGGKEMLHVDQNLNNTSPSFNTLYDQKYVDTSPNNSQIIQISQITQPHNRFRHGQ